MRLRFLILMLLASLAAAQNGNNPSVNSLTFPVFSLNPAPVAGASISIVGASGQATWYFWASANYQLGSVISPIGSLANAPNTLTSGNYISIIPDSYPAGVLSVDILATTGPLAPVGACNCAVATGLTSGGTNFQSNTLSSYTVSILNPQAFNLRLTNEVTGTGATSLLLRNALTGALVCNLSTGCGTGGPGGSPTQLQFNDGGLFNGVSSSSWDKTYSILTLGNSTQSEMDPLYEPQPGWVQILNRTTSSAVSPNHPGGYAFTSWSQATNTYFNSIVGVYGIAESISNQPGTHGTTTVNPVGAQLISICEPATGVTFVACGGADFEVFENGAGTIQNAFGIQLETPSITGGSITNAIGAWIFPQTGAATNIGAKFDGDYTGSSDFAILINSPVARSWFGPICFGATPGTCSSTFSSGAGVPSGTCGVGSLYTNTAASSLSTLVYACYPANTWNAVTVP